MLDLSIIMPSYNQPDTIEKCLTALLKQNSKLKFEIIVVDSSQKDIQIKIEKICQCDERIKLIKQERQTHPGTARNIGIKAAQAAVVALIDSDCLAGEGWIDRVYEYAEENVIISGVIENGTPKSIWGTCEYLVAFNEFFPFKGKKRFSPFAGAGNFTCHKKVFEKIGYFSDDRVFEDFLLSKQFTGQGGKIWIMNDVVITHLNRTAPAKVLKSMFILGKHSAIARKTNGLGPKIIFKIPFLAFGLAFYRYYSILSRIYRHKYWFKFLLYTPLIVYLLCHWSWGFYRGAKTAFRTTQNL